MLKFVTIDAAYAMQMENEIGNIATGNRADFTVLEEDPLLQPAIRLKNIPIWAIVFEGRVYPI